MNCRNCKGRVDGIVGFEMEDIHGQKVYFCRIECADAYARRLGMRVVEAKGEKTDDPT